MTEMAETNFMKFVTEKVAEIIHSNLFCKKNLHSNSLLWSLSFFFFYISVILVTKPTNINFLIKIQNSNRKMWKFTERQIANGKNEIMNKQNKDNWGSFYQGKWLVKWETTVERYLWGNITIPCKVFAKDFNCHQCNFQ